MTAPGTPDFYVSTRYVLDDKASTPTNRLEQAQSSLNRTVQHTQRSFGDLNRLLAGGAGFFAAYRMATRAKGALVDYGEKLREIQIGTAALVGTTMDFGDMTGPERFQRSMGVSAKAVEDLRNAANDGLGEFQDYIGAYQQLLIPLGRAGEGLDDILDVSRLLVPVAKTLNIDVANAGLQIQQMFLGNARSQHRLLQMLQINTAEANKLSQTQAGQAKLVEMVRDRLKEWAPAAEEFGRTLDSQMGTLKDNIRFTIARAGGPLRDAMTSGVAETNEWLKRNQDRIDAIIERAGPRLAAAFTQGFQYATTAVEFLVKHGETMVRLAKQYVQYMLLMKGIKAGGALYHGATGVGAIAGIGRGGAGAALGGVGLPFSGAAMGATRFGVQEAAREGARGMAYWIGTRERPGHFFLPLRGAVSSGALALKSGFAVLGSALAGIAVGKLVGDAITRAVGRHYDVREAQENTERRAERNIVHSQAMVRHYEHLGGLAEEVRATDSSGAYARRADPREMRIHGADERITQAAQRERARWMSELLTARPKEFLAIYDELPEHVARIQRQALDRMAKAGELSINHVRLAEIFADPELRGKTQVNQNVDMRGARIEVKIDSGEYEPDTIAFTLEDQIIRQASARVQSRMVPGLAGAR